MTYKDKNETILKMQDYIIDEKGKIGQIINVRGVAIVKFLHSGILLSKLDLTQYEKKDTGGYEI